MSPPLYRVGMIGLALVLGLACMRIDTKTRTTLPSVSVGYVGKSTISFKGSFTATPACATMKNSPTANFTFSAQPNGWYKIGNLTANTTYTFFCGSANETVSFQARTFANAEQVITSSGFAVGMTTYYGADCFLQSRKMAYNQGTGYLEIWGENTSTCYAVYNGLTWQVAVMTGTANANPTFRQGTGLVSFTDGSIYASDFLDDGVNPLQARLYHCTANCELAASWTIGDLLDSDGQSANLALNSAQNLLVYTHGNTGSVRFCDPSTLDCTVQANWTLPLILTAGGIDGQSFAHYDSVGNLWTGLNDTTNPLWFCAAGNDCSLLPSWVGGALTADLVTYSQHGKPLIYEENGYLRILSFYGLGLNTLVSGECLLSSGTCGTVGAGVFTNLGGTSEVVLDAFDVNPYSPLYFFRTATGFRLDLDDSANAMNTSFQSCTGDFATCRSINGGSWSARALLVDGVSYSSGSYFHRETLRDGNNAPFTLVTGAAPAPLTLLYLE